MSKTNYAKLAGILEKDFEYSHTSGDENFYISKIAVERLSGFQDHINIVVSEHLLSSEFEEGSFVEITGTIRSIHKPFEDGLWHLFVYIFVYNIKIAETRDFKNQVAISGYMWNNPVLKPTASGKYISDFVIRSERTTGRFSTIPCIAWGSNAFYAKRMQPGDKILLKGRLQSREYTKFDEVREIIEFSANEIW